MNWKSKPVGIALVFILCLAGSFTAPAVDVPATPPTYVVDLADIIDNGVEQKLNGYLQELEQKTTAQMIVLTLKSLEGEAIEDLAITLAHDKWKLGQAGKDNGLLLVVALDDRKYRIEVGYGLEGIIPDGFAGEVGRRYMAPYFKENDFSGGIYSASLVLANTIADDAGVKITGMPVVARRTGSSGGREQSGPCGKIGFLLFMVFAVYMFIRHPRAFLTFILLSSLGGGRRGGWGGGSGGFGGFGGGGGGGFGGGGASGSW